MDAYRGPAVDRAIQAHAHASTAPPPKDLASLRTRAELDALTPADRNRLFLEDPDRYRSLRDVDMARSSTSAVDAAESQGPSETS